MFNDDQKSWAIYIGGLPKEAKCDCGWALRGECFGPSCYGKVERGGYIPKDKPTEAR